MPYKKQDYEKTNKSLNKIADQNEKLGLSRKDIFDDGVKQSRNQPEDRGYQQDWPDHMKEHFKAQDNVNQIMEDRMTAALRDEDV